MLKALSHIKVQQNACATKRFVVLISNSSFFKNHISIQYLLGGNTNHPINLFPSLGEMATKGQTAFSPLGGNSFRGLNMFPSAGGNTQKGLNALINGYNTLLNNRKGRGGEDETEGK